ncbi:MAG: hypothetical protein HW390_2572 [Candidatus Brocadiaceae bacterium]|nr:hypothetical protein [Candidatus Brocadiaceae bacterium]
MEPGILGNGSNYRFDLYGLWDAEGWYDQSDIAFCNINVGIITDKTSLSAPILDTKTGNPVGVIINFIPIAEIEKVLSGAYAKKLGAISWAKGRWNTLEVYLVNRDKLMLTKSRFARDAVLRQLVNTLPVNACLTENNTEITKIYKDYRGIEVVGASMCFPSLKWVLLAEIDKDEALAATKDMLRNAIITAVVIVVMFCLLLAAFLARVVKPIRRVSDAAREVAGGNFDIIVPVKTHDEIATLCESFNYMTCHIKDKTAALVKTEEELRLLQTMILTIIESKDTHAAFGFVLRKVCETTGWIYGEAWIPSPDGTQLECCPSWYSMVEGLEEFRKASEGATFLPGIGLPGMAWLSKKPVWIQDVQTS